MNGVLNDLIEPQIIFFETNQINYNDVEEVYDVEIIKMIQNKIKTEKDTVNTNKLSKEKVEELKKTLYDSKLNNIIRITDDILNSEEKATISIKKRNVSDLIYKKLEDQHFITLLANKYNCFLNDDMYKWLISNFTIIMENLFKNYPMIVSEKKENILVSEILHLCFQEYIKIKENQLQLEKIDDEKKDIMYCSHFYNVYNYKLNNINTLLMRHHFGFIPHSILKKISRNMNINYLRLGILYDKNILYHCILELLNKYYYIDTRIEELRKKVSILKHSIVLNNLNEEDFDIYFMKKNNNFDPKERFDVLKSFIKNDSISDDSEIPLFSSMFNYNIFIIDETHTPLDINRFCFKSNRDNIVIFKKVFLNINMYEPIIEFFENKINLSTISYETFRKSEYTRSIFNSNHDLIKTLISNYIKIYIEDLDSYSSKFQNFDISDFYLSFLLSENYLTDKHLEMYKKSKKCGTSLLFSSDMHSLPITIGRKYKCPSIHPFLYRIDEKLDCFEDLCCTNNINSEGIGTFISNYDYDKKCFNVPKIPKNKYKTFLETFYSFHRNAFISIIEGRTITYEELKIILPILDTSYFHDYTQIKKFINENPSWISSLIAFTKIALEDNIIITLSGEKNNKLLLSHFNNFKRAWTQFKNNNISFINDFTQNIEFFIYTYSNIIKEEKPITNINLDDNKNIDLERKELPKAEEIIIRNKNEIIIPEPTNQNKYIKTTPDNIFRIYYTDKDKIKYLIFDKITKELIENKSDIIYSKLIEKNYNNESIYSFLETNLKKHSNIPDIFINDVLMNEIQNI